MIKENTFKNKVYNHTEANKIYKPESNLTRRISQSMCNEFAVPVSAS